MRRSPAPGWAGPLLGLAVLGGLSGCFTDRTPTGKSCRSDGECGELRCLEEVCGGPSDATESEAGTDAAGTDPAATSSTGSTTASPPASGTEPAPGTSSGSSSGDPGEGCECNPQTEVCVEQTCVPASRILYINFDGGDFTFSPGMENAALNVHQLFDWLQGEFPGYGDAPEQRAQILAEVREIWAPFRVTVTDERPADTAPFTMAVLTSDPLMGTFIVSFPDCEDQRLGNIAFLSLHATDGVSVQVKAEWISYAFARGFGLEGVTHPDDVLGAGAEFVDECAPKDPNVGWGCQPVHERFCEAEQQNSFAELSDILGLLEE